MGMYSTIQAPLVCKRCGLESQVEVQFKYGNLWLHTYNVGDVIVWGRTQVGDASEVAVAALGVGGCPACDDEAQFDVLIDHGRIASVAPSTGQHDYFHNGDYVVLAGGR